MRKYLFLSLLFFTTIQLSFAQHDIDSLDNKFTLKLFLLDECKICWNYFPLLNELHSEYKDIVDFVGYFPNFSSKKENIDSLKKEYEIQYPLKTDYYKKQSIRYDIKVTPEVVLINNQTGKVIYQGRIDNNFVRIGKRRTVVSQHELKDALSAVRNNQDIKVKRTESVGCFVNYSDGLSNFKTKRK